MIIDASVALKWLAIEEGSSEARVLLDRVDLMAPALLHSEVANGLRRKQRRGELDNDLDMVAVMDSLVGALQTVDEVPVMARALECAAELNHSVYDCVYLALAERLGRELVTADLKFVDKVKASAMAGLVQAL